MLDIRYIKIVVAGDGGVGKTTMLHRYINRKYLDDTRMTIGLEIFNKDVKVNGSLYQVIFWDVGGQEHFRELHEFLIKGVMGAIFMFDLSRMNTLKSLDEWLAILRAYDKDIPILIVGSKYDLIADRMDDDEITNLNEYILNVKEERNFFDYVITSSKIGYNIDETFSALLEKVRNHMSLKQIFNKFSIPTANTSEI